MTTAPKITTGQLADILDKALTVIEARGWHRGYFFDDEQREEGTPIGECRVCAVGAINTAVCGYPTLACREGENFGEIADLAFAAENAVARHLGATNDPRAVARWNDELQRTQDDVAQAIRDTAAELRAGEAS